MSLSKKFSRPFPWFWIGIAGVFAISVYLRFWGLSRFNTLVFDEVYYAKFANDYLTHTQFFNAHPPLSQYLIAIAMWIGSHIPIGQDTVNILTGSWRSTWSYRWLNALTGSFIPLVVAGIAYQLSHRRSYALIAAIFAAADGLFLVESRYALNNVYLVILGLLGQWFLLLALQHNGRKRRFWLVGAGIGFGASAAIKWNGLWFLLGAYLIWIAAWAIQWMQFLDRRELREKSHTPQYSPLENLTQLNLLSILFYLGIIPVLVYSISWIPHLQIVPQPGFWEMQKQILEYHERIGNGSKVHPYCSAWYTWLLMLRPVAYFYKTAHSLSEPVPIVAPPLPAQSVKVIYDVHAMANPLLWWFSTAAIAFLFWRLVKSFVQQGALFERTRETNKGELPITNTWIALYLILNWLANLLPWIRVTRCTFIYHYMGSSVFAALALAWLVDHWLRSLHLSLRVLGVTAIFLVLLAFVFWMPLYLGLPLSPESYKMRLWFRSWI
ncbi:MAG TPA: dolichyl-phosphate-mannose--protein O-mannosyl transferase [Cyanobacteria bacterium UBA11049]|nr:dolichyl-phosphate-mannose--protein O-mannosyl transferase [Cyanobacteria bacterium UBA11049]